MNITLNVVALVISLAALGVSSFFAIKQVNTAHHANQLPIVIDIYREIRSPQFRQQEETLWNRLPALERNTSFSHLPKDLKDAAYDVCYAYLMLAYLVSLRIIDRRLAILPIHYRIIRTWEVVQPFVLQERDARGDELSFLNLLESFVDLVKRQDISYIVKEVGRSFND